MKLKEFINEVSDNIRRGELSYFLGAGVSRGSGYVNWRELLAEIASDLGLEIEKEHDLIELAQFHKNTKRNRNKLNQKIIDEFSKKTEENELTNILFQLPIDSIWTTNYDQIIEKEFIKLNKVLEIKIDERNLSTNLVNRDATLYKLHGDITDVNNAIITRDDYELFNDTRGLFINKLIGEMISRSFLFIGYSFSDPNIRAILSKIRHQLKDSNRNHYFIMKKSQNEYEYKRQELEIEDLKEYGIQTLFVDNFEEIPKIFKEVRNRVFEKNVFISGSGHVYDEFGTVSDSKELIKKLTKELVKKGYHIINGHGQGVGESIISGLIEALSEEQSIIDNPFTLKVFPQRTNDKQKINELWTSLRENMISKSTSTIFLFGNKLVDNKVVLATGMDEEYEISKKYGSKIILVPSTGYKTKEIYERNISEYQDLENISKTKNVDELVKLIIEKIIE